MEHNWKKITEIITEQQCQSCKMIIDDTFFYSADELFEDTEKYNLLHGPYSKNHKRYLLGFLDKDKIPTCNEIIMKSVLE